MVTTLDTEHVYVIPYIMIYTVRFPANCTRAMTQPTRHIRSRGTCTYVMTPTVAHVL